MLLGVMIGMLREHRGAPGKSITITVVIAIRQIPPTRSIRTPRALNAPENAHLIPANQAQFQRSFAGPGFWTHPAHGEL